MHRKWELVFEALEKLRAELDGQWPVPRRQRRKTGHMMGYSRARGRREIRRS